MANGFEICKFLGRFIFLNGMTAKSSKSFILPIMAQIIFHIFVFKQGFGMGVPQPCALSIIHTNQ